MTNTIDAQTQVAGSLADTLLNLLDQLEQRALGSQPTDSKGKPTGTALYMHMPEGLPVDPKQFANPWTPAGGDTLATAMDNGQQVKQDPATPTSPAANGSTPPPPQLDHQLQASIASAFATSLLVDELYEVTGDGVFKPYPTSRSLSFAYKGVISGMQPDPAPAPSAAVRKAIDDALAQLYVYDAKGNITGKTPQYKNYLSNSAKWAQAKNDMAIAQAQAMADPILGSTWPQQSVTYQNAVDSAHDDLMAEGAGDIETALAVVSSEGRSIQAAMVAQARTLFDAWNLGIAGVPSQTAYSMIEPASWWDHTDDDIGFTKLSINTSKTDAHAGASSSSFAHNWYNAQGSSNSAGGGGLFFGIALGASGSSSQDSTDAQAHGEQHGRTHVDSTATNVTIELEWGICRIERPWLVSDLFHMDGWYLVNAKKNAVSDGTIQGQVDNDKQLLPMIPTAFLVVRNVKISADHWGTAADSLRNAYQDSQNHTDDSSSSESGSVGFLCFGSSASHSQYDVNGNGGSSSSDDWGWSFSGNQQHGTLEINGSQIVGWIGEIVPACPVKDDPGLAQTDDSKKSDSSTSDTKTDAGKG